MMITIEEVCKSFDEQIHKLLLQEQGLWVDKLSDILKKVEGPHMDIEEFLKELRGDILEAITSHRSLTCDDCVDAGKCPFSGDFYNTNGDCLVSK